MRILIAAGIYPPDAGGPAVHAKAQFEGFAGLGMETSLVALAHFRQWPKGIRHLLFFLALTKEARSSDLIYAHDAVGVGLPALIAARIAGNKIVVRVGGDLAWERYAQQENLSMKEWYARGAYRINKIFILSRFVLRRVDMVVVIGKSLADLYIQKYGVSQSKVKIILNPIPEVSSIEIKKEKNIVFASRLTGYKNLGIIIKVLAKIFPNHPDLRFTIVGDGPYKSTFEQLVDKLLLKSNITFTGTIPMSEVLEKTARCLFTIAPALTEFNPNYVLQGIALGKPFLISRENDLPFQVPEELIINPRDEAQIEERILGLLDENKYQDLEMKVKNIDFKMSWDDNLKANEEMIKSILRGSK